MIHSFTDISPLRQEDASRPTMRFVVVKMPDQLGLP